MVKTAPIHRTLRGVVLCLLGVALVAGVAPLSRYVVHHRRVDPILFGGIWLVAAGVWAMLIGRINTREPPLQIRKSWRFLLLAGLIHLANAIGAFVGVAYVPASVAGFVGGMNVPIAFLLAVALLKEPARRKQILGLVLAVAGLASLVTAGRGGGEVRVVGIALVFGGAACSACMDVLAKARFQRFAMWALVCARGLFPGICFLAYTRLISRAPWPDANVAVLIVIGALLGPCMGVYLVFSSLRHIPLTTAAVLRATAPALTALYAAVILGERLGWRQAAAGLLIMAGAALAPPSPGRQRTEADDARAATNEKPTQTCATAL